MASLTGSSIASSYKSLLKLNSNTGTLVAGDGSNAIQIVHSDDSTGVTSPLFLNTDRLGIGGQPSRILESINTNAGADTLLLQLRNNSSNTSTSSSLRFVNSTSGTATAGGSEISSIRNANDGGSLTIKTAQDTSATLTTALTIDSSQNATFSGNLTVATASNPELSINNTGKEHYKIISADNGGTAQLHFKNETLSAYPLVVSHDSSAGSRVGIGTHNAHGYDAGADNLVVYDSANAGITIAGGTSGQSNIHFGDGVGVSSYRGVIQYRHGSEDEMRFWTAGSHKLTLNSSGDLDFNGNYVVNEQGRQNHVANTMSSPYYRFDGTDDLINIGDKANLDFSRNLSISVWAKFPSATITGVNSLFGKWLDSGSEKSYFFAVFDDEKLYFYTSSNGSNATAVSSPVLTDLDKWNNFTVTYNAGAVTFYRNGVSIGTGTGESSINDSSANAYIGAYQAGANFFNGEMSKVQVFNNTLTATEVKELYSGASVAYKYKGANQTDLVTSNFANNGSFPFDTFTGASANGFTAVRSTSGTKVAGTADEIVLVKGKSYRVSFDVTLTSGTFPLTRVRESQTSGTLIEILSAGGASNGDKINFEFTATASGTYVVSFESSNSVSFAIANFNFVPIGAVAEFDGSSAGEKVWGDKSGNSLDGTVSGATVENAPYDAGTEYEEGTFTPTIVSSGGVTLTAGSGNTAQYVRVGNKVTCNGFVIVNGLNSATTSHTISLHGLPYAGRSGNRTAVVFGNNENMAMTDGDNMQGIIYDTNSTISLYVNDATGSNASNMLVSEWSDDGKTYFSVTYFV